MCVHTFIIHVTCGTGSTIILLSIIIRTYYFMCTVEGTRPLRTYCTCYVVRSVEYSCPGACISHSHCVQRCAITNTTLRFLPLPCQVSPIVFSLFSLAQRLVLPPHPVPVRATHLLNYCKENCPMGKQILLVLTIFRLVETFHGESMPWLNCS